MIIFEITQTLMKYLGYNTTYSQSRWYRAYNYLIFLFSSIIILPICTFFFKNLTNVATMVEIMSLCSGEVNAMIKGAVYIRNRPRLHRLLVNLQNTVNYKESVGRLEHYANMNRWTNIFTRIDMGWMTTSILSICLGPILGVLYHATVLGDLQPEMYRQPVGVVFPFNSDTTPGYEFVYVLCFVSITCIGYTISFTDCVFMGSCAQIVACQRDLRDMLAEVDVNRCSTEPLTTSERRDVERRLRECVRFHYAIRGFIDDLGTVSSPIVFAQFILSILQMCSLAFMMQNITQLSLDRTISFVVTGVVALIELLIYCYSGDAVTSEGVEIAKAAYAMPWDRWPVRLRRYVSVIMMRTQEPTVFQGLKMVSCSLTTYTTVLNMVGSSLALLRSVVV